MWSEQQKNSPRKDLGKEKNKKNNKQERSSEER